MNDNKNMEPQNAEESNIIPLIDEDGKEINFEIIGDAEIDGVVYYAMTPAGAQENNEGIIEYVLLKLVKDEDGEEVFRTDLSDHANGSIVRGKHRVLHPFQYVYDWF